MMKQVLLLVTLVSLALGGCGGTGDAPAGRGAAPTVVQGVTVEQAKNGPITDYQEVVGTVRAANQFVLASRIAGTVTEMRVREGDRVKKGELLAVLSADETTAGAAAATAGVEESERALTEAKSRLKLADATFERYRTLFSEQAVTRQEFESRQAEQEVALQGVLRAESRLVQAREQARASSALSAYTRLTAPFAGIVTARPVDRGATVFPGTPVLSLDDDTAFHLEVQVPESLKKVVRNGQGVTVNIDGQPAQQGNVAEIVPTVDPGSRSFTVKIAVTGKGLRSGAYGKALFPVGSSDGIQLPGKALLERGALTFVWVIDSSGIARMRLVKPGTASGDRVTILSGITAGERVAVAGADRLSDGAKVE